MSTIRMLKGMSMKKLQTETIVAVKCGSDLTPACGSYGAYTVLTESGKEYVIWTSMGEVNLSEIILA